MKSIHVTADAVIIDNDRILLIKRGIEPFKGMWALPGGHVDYGERVEEAAVREAKEETGLDVKVIKLTGVYSDPNRDPRGHTMGVAYLCEAKGKKPRAGDDAKEVWWWPLDDLPDLAFDHKLIVADAVEQLE